MMKHFALLAAISSLYLLAGCRLIPQVAEEPLTEPVDPATDSLTEPVDPEPNPDPIAVEWPTVTQSLLYMSARPEWNISFLRSTSRGLLIGEYDNNSRKDSRIVLTLPKAPWSLPDGGWETLQQPVQIGDVLYAPTEIGPDRIVWLNESTGLWGTGHKRTHPYCLNGMVYNGRPVLFSWSRHSDDKLSVMQYADTGEVFGKVALNGVVVSSIQIAPDNAILCIDGERSCTMKGVNLGGRMKVVTKWDGKYYGGTSDGDIWRFREDGTGWEPFGHEQTGGPIYCMIPHGGYLWFTTSTPARLGVVRPDGAMKILSTGEQHGYGWFGPQVVEHEGMIYWGAKKFEGSSWRLAIWLIDIG